MEGQNLPLPGWNRLNPVWHARKMLIFRATMGQLLKDLMSWARCQNNPIDLNFHLQKSSEIFGKKSVDNSDRKSQT